MEQPLEAVITFQIKVNFEKMITMVINSLLKWTSKKASALQGRPFNGMQCVGLSPEIVIKK